MDSRRNEVIEEAINNLKSFQVHPEVSNLYMAILEDIFKTKEGDREKEIDRFQKALAELEPQLLKIDRMYLKLPMHKCRGF